MIVMNGATNNFPAQKKKERQKNEAWAKECVKAGCDNGLFSSAFLTDYNEVRTNMDLYNSILDTDDMMARCDPFGLTGADFPYAPEHYPIPNTKINLLVGEEIKRKFDWKAKVINPDAVNQKLADIKETIQAKLSEMIAENLPPDQMEKKMKELDKYIKYDYKDLREIKATRLLKHVMAKENVAHKWNMGFLDGLVGGKEIYSLDIVGGDPRLRKCNPANVRVIRKGQSPDITDADIIVEWGYYSPGIIIDDYHEYLKDSDVKYIDTYATSIGSGNGGESITDGQEPNLMAGTFSMIQGPDGKMISSDSSTGSRKFLPFYDVNGGILVTRVVWRSFRMIMKLKYYEENTGAQLFKFVDEFYEPETDKGEEIVNKIWTSDWWEGHRIGENLYVKMRPFPVKSYGMSNPTGTLCPYIGGDYTVDGEPTTSLMGRLKPYAYYYDFMMYKLWETLSKYKGVVGYLDLAMIPEGWEIEDALYYADKMGWLPIDSFKEANKGKATGSIGNMNTNRSPMNFDVGNYVQQNILILNFLKEEMSDVSGVSKQREGSISSNELVGNTERAVQQSSHVTEMYFHFHEKIKLQCLKALLEVAKYTYRGNTLAVQFINDDHSSAIETIDMNDFREIDFGIDVANSPDYSRIYSSLQQLAQAGMQNDKINFSQIMDIFMDPSISSVRRKIERAEDEKYEREAQSAKSQNDAMKEMKQMELEAEISREERKANMDQMLEQVKTDGKLSLEKMKGLILSSLKDAASVDVMNKLESDMEKMTKELEFQANENEKERNFQSRENSEDRTVQLKTKKSITK